MMKTIKWIVAGLLLTVGAQASVITTNALNDSYTHDANDGSGSGDGTADGAFNVAGYEQYIGAVAGGAEERKAFFNIELPTDDGVNTLASSADISTATLRVYYSRNNGTPQDNLSLFYATKSSVDTVAGDMYSTAYVDTGLGIDLGSASGQYYEFDVTSYIKDAYDSAGNVASFRFEVDNVILGVGGANYALGGADATSPGVPQLVLETIPEPATIGMLGLGALITLYIRRKKTL